MTDVIQTLPLATDQTSSLTTYPKVYRLRTIERVPDSTGLIRNTAEIFNRKASLRVQWLSKHVDPLLLRGRIVIPKWLPQPYSNQGALHIAQLSSTPEVLDISMIPLIPDSWIGGDEQLLIRLQQHWLALSAPYRRWFNTLFWNHPARLYRFLTCPASLHHHHNFKHGTLIHTLECTDLALLMSKVDDKTDKDLLRFACLIHDAGKSDEYILQRNAWHISQRGRLLGHKVTIIQWLSETWQIAGISQQALERVLHVLTATRGCKWNDTREPQIREANYLSHADRLSVERA